MMPLKTSKDQKKDEDGRLALMPKTALVNGQ
jgi:hypothetical protein